MANRYNQSKIFRDENGVQYLNRIEYPAIPIRDSDIFITTVVGERLENIAYQYYNDGSLWWIIAKANGLNDAVIANADKKIRIPTQIESILKKLEIESY